MSGDYGPTPGEWLATDGGTVVDAGNRLSIICHHNDDGNYGNATMGEIRANARLIAAAPDLLKALEGLLDRSERQAAGMLEEASCEIWYAHRDRCRAAIAKARGGR